MKRFLLGLLLLASCAPERADFATSTAAHTEGEPLVDAPSVVWANESFEDFVRIIPKNRDATFLPADHPLVVRLQFWADRFYEAAVAAQPDVGARVPSPKISIRKSDEQNAWVSPLFTGWPMEAHVDGSAPVTTTDGGHLDVSMVGVTERWRIMARELTPAAGEPEALFGFLNQRFDTCRLAMENGTVGFSSGCRAKDDAVNAGGRFAFDAVSRWLSLTTERIAFFQVEEENVATIAHELGHYFRAHAVIPRDQFNYFYSLDDMSPKKPVLDPRFAAETSAVREKLLHPSSLYVDENILMQKQHLGFYTTEQEADELGMELLARVGLSPDLIQKKQLHSMQTEPEPILGTPYAECLRLRAAGWKDAVGNPVSIPVGRPADVHHDSCFRVFNADREQAIHHYVPSGAPPVPPGNWDEALAAIPQ